MLRAAPNEGPDPDYAKGLGYSLAILRRPRGPIVCFLQLVWDLAPATGTAIRSSHRWVWKYFLDTTRCSSRVAATNALF